ncbi:hypothetical protein [Riemerella anatipestifer]|uniref:hypothetical protein n=1 Tax=Riemerella anatipestifer TaxID=34085 RepID=UPI0021A9F06A|nr:hypothetical protein [Riemerella anatipestifer]MCU7571517.1 hypothetical protein [Riemerella anatipestifer]MCW0509889.1 hypothetical protein [Riemerella anatipestifer]MDY3526199.1 hypothetical protein [Riemerella anatipestifer]
MPLREGEGHCWSSSYKGVRDRCGLCKIATVRRPTLEEALELERDTPKNHIKKLTPQNNGASCNC